EHRLEVDVVELVTVDREERAALLPAGRGEAKAATPAEGLRLGDDDDLGAGARELLVEQALLPHRAADDDPIDARPHELSHLVLRERMTCDRHERLREPTGGVAHAGRLPAGKDDRFHATRRGRGSRAQTSPAGLRT